MPHSVGKLVESLIIAIPDHKDGQLDSNPKVKALVREHSAEINDYPPDKSYSVAVNTCPITIERIPWIPINESKLIDPGTAPAIFAPDAEHPNGTQKDDWAERHKHMTVMQQHCSYWDKDGDGIIWPSDTWRGVRAWGWNSILSALAVFITNVNLSYPTVPNSWLPDP